jgi:amiloride-sensitive sodium channel
VTTSEDLKKLSWQDRMCFMDGERKLKYFKFYTQKNCEIECLSSKLLEKCKCIPYDFIRQNNTKVCELFDYICVDQVKNETIYEEDQEKLCNCLQPCNYISYSYEFVETKLKNRDQREGYVRIKFKDNEFVSMQRIRQFTVVDFLSYVGGLLGLFAGISVLSFFEILYFFSLRLVCEVLRLNRVGIEN